MTKPPSKQEIARAERIHRAFLDIRAQSSKHQKLTRALKALTARTFRAPYCGYAFGSIRHLYYRWLRDPRPEIFLHKYAPGKPRLPDALIREVFARLAAEPTRSASEVIEDLARAWRRGEGVPGVPSWKGHQETAPAHVPFSPRSLLRHVGAVMPISWTEQRRRRRAALAEIAELDRMIEEFLGPVISERSVHACPQCGSQEHFHVNGVVRCCRCLRVRYVDIGVSTQHAHSSQSRDGN